MIRIYKSNSIGEHIVQTDALSLPNFIEELGPAILSALKKNPDDEALTLEGILSNAFFLAFKLQGYKSDRVHIRQVLTSGFAAPEDCEMIVDMGVFRSFTPLDYQIETNRPVTPEEQMAANDLEASDATRKEPRW